MIPLDHWPVHWFCLCLRRSSFTDMSGVYSWSNEELATLPPGTLPEVWGAGLSDHQVLLSRGIGFPDREAAGWGGSLESRLSCGLVPSPRPTGERGRWPMTWWCKILGDELDHQWLELDIWHHDIEKSGDWTIGRSIQTWAMNALRFRNSNQGRRNGRTRGAFWLVAWWGRDISQGNVLSWWFGNSWVAIPIWEFLQCWHGFASFPTRCVPIVGLMVTGSNSSTVQSLRKSSLGHVRTLK